MYCLLCGNYDSSRGCCRWNILKLQPSCLFYTCSYDNLGFNLYTILAREIDRMIHPVSSKVLYVVDRGISTLRAVSEDPKEMKRIFGLVDEVLANIQKYLYPISLVKEEKVYPVAKRYLVLTPISMPILRLDMFVYDDLSKEEKKKASRKKKKKVRKEK